LCDPEGGTIKNAALFYENRGLPAGIPKLLSSADFYAFCEENLKQPDKSLIEKKGKGIYRRFFYYIPAGGEGAVNYQIPQWEKITDSNKIHQMRDLGEPGFVEHRQRSCHCVPCYSERFEDCEYLEQMPLELAWKETSFARKTMGRRPGLRSDVETLGVQTSIHAEPGQIAAFYIHDDQECWMLGLILDPGEGATAWGQDRAHMVDGCKAAQIVQNPVPEKAPAGQPQNWMGKLLLGEQVIYVQKLEPAVTRGNMRSEYLLTEKKFACFTSDMRVCPVRCLACLINPLIGLFCRMTTKELRQSSRVGAKATMLYTINLEDKKKILASLAISDANE
jgi:hypothetical protein